jgi:hypothetical protein
VVSVGLFVEVVAVIVQVSPAAEVADFVAVAVAAGVIVAATVAAAALGFVAGPDSHRQTVSISM